MEMQGRQINFTEIKFGGGKTPSQELDPCTSLVAQWIRFLLPMQGTQVQSLVWEDPTGQWSN